MDKRLDEKLIEPLTDLIAEVMDIVVPSQTHKDWAKESGFREMNEVRAKAVTALKELIREERGGAVYGFHEYLIDKNMLQGEDDQAFNYGRLHKAIDAYVEELQDD